MIYGEWGLDGFGLHAMVIILELAISERPFSSTSSAAYADKFGVVVT